MKNNGKKVNHQISRKKIEILSIYLLFLITLYQTKKKNTFSQRILRFAFFNNIKIIDLCFYIIYKTKYLTIE